MGRDIFAKVAYFSRNFFGVPLSALPQMGHSTKSEVEQPDNTLSEKMVKFFQLLLK